ncbi:MAG: hypothetical protein KKA67_00020 [Spirochaetes bacterium]|nr:hypothetical protein [Spirochaetota bacterium]MBU1079030.1 hypothetical protein [Spirochaetota bacterium]
MPEPGSIAAAAGTVAALLVPVVLLLFVALRMRRRVRYPHGLLLPKDDSRPSAALFRALRLYYDAAIDAACAVVAGLAIAGALRPIPLKGAATVIDASLSMLSGMRGDRPLDEAARLAFSDEALRGSRLFALGWDPRTTRHTLRDVSGDLDASDSPQAFAARLEASEAFVSADYGLVGGLIGRGYDSVVFITDDASVEGLGIEIRALAPKAMRYAIRSSAAWDDERGRSVVRFVTAGGASIEGLWRVHDDGSLSRAKPEEYYVLPSPSGFELSFSGEGLWAVQWDGRFTPFVAPGRPGALAAKGEFASRVVSALGPIGAPGRVSAEEGALVVREGGKAGARGYVSISRARLEPCVLPPRLTLGAVVAAGQDRKADLALGGAALASPEAAVPFWALRAGAGLASRPGDERPRRAGPEPVRAGEGFLYPASERVRLVAPPASEYAPSGPRSLVKAGPPAEGRLAVAVVLALLYGLKLWLSRRLRGADRPVL